MTSKKLKRILYVFVILIMLVLGVVMWMQSSGGVVEEQTFTINNKQLATFVYNTETETPQRLHITVKGTLDCDAILTIREDGETRGIRSRRSFPLKAGELKDRDFQTMWTHTGMIIEFKTDGCTANDVKVKIEVLE